MSDTDSNSLGKYPATAKWLHWLVGVIVIIMLIFGRTLEALPLDERAQMIMGHSGLGTLVLLLMVVRWTYRLNNEPPGPTSNMSQLQTRLSKLMHWALYTLLIVQPVLGILQAMYIADYEIVAFGLINYSSFVTNDTGMARTFHILHSLNAIILSVLVLGHIGAGLYHHFMQHDNVLRRMWPTGKLK